MSALAELYCLKWCTSSIRISLQCRPHSVLPVSRLRGTIPTSLFALPGIRVLDLGGNRFSGTLPDSLLKMTSLAYLELGANRLSGWLALLLQPATQHLLPQLWHCQPELTQECPHTAGTLPADWHSLPALQHMSLYLNAISGPLTAGAPPTSTADVLRHVIYPDSNLSE